MANATRLTMARDQARPKKLGRYELEECLGVDAGIETFRARVRGLAGFDRIFAVKCHRRGRGTSLNLNDPCIRVAKRTAALNDARIARVLDADVIDGVAVVVTEFVHGLDVDRFRDWAQSSGVLATGTDEVAQKWQKVVGYIGAEAASALAYLHGLSPAVVHGGLSPRNVIVTARGGVKLLDIGLRRAAPPSDDGNPPRAFSYATIDEWALKPAPPGDVRALGAILFELATGEPPPVGMGSLAARKVLGALWPGMADVLASMLSEDPESRPSSADVASTFGEFWSDVPDASMIAEVAALVRNFSSFVADGTAPVTPAPVAPEPRPPALAEVEAESTGEVPSATVVAPVPVFPAEAKAASTSGSFAAVPDGPTRMAADSAYVSALFAALPADPTMPAFKTLPAGLHAPVEAMAAEIEAADLESSISLDGLPPPPATDEPEAFASDLLVPDEEDAASSGRVATSIDPVPVPEAAIWGAQALAALGSQAGVEVPAAWGPVAEPATDAALADEAQVATLPPPPVSEPAIDEAFAFEEAAAPVARPMRAEVAARPKAATQTLLFTARDNLEDELVDERGEPEGEAAQAFGSPGLVEAPAYEPVAEEVTEQRLPADSFEAPEQPSLDLARDAEAVGRDAAAEEDPIFAATLPGGLTEPCTEDGAAEWSPPRLAHAMKTSGESPRRSATRTAKRSAEDLQASDPLAEPVMARRRRTRVMVALAIVLLAAGGVAVVKLASPRTTVQSASRSEPVKRTATADVKRAVPPAAAERVLPAKAAVVEKKPPAERASAPARPATVAAPQPARAKDGMAQLAIASRPDGAAVWVDGEERCKTPCSLRMRPGSARLVLIRAGHRTSETTVEVADGAKVDRALEAVDPPLSGEARFRVECATHGKLPIVVDGRETGILCPYSKMRVEPGRHSVGLYDPATGKTLTKDITLSAGVRSIIFSN